MSTNTTTSADKLRAIALSLLMVTSISVGMVAISGTAVANHGTNQNASTPLPSGVPIDNTTATDTTVDARTVVANVTYPSPGNVSKVHVNLTAGGGAANLTAGDIQTIRVVLYNGTTERARMTVDYTSTNTTVDFGQNITDVNRIEIYATPSAGASEGDVIDAVYTLAWNPNGDTYDTHENQTILTTSTGFVSGRVSDQNNNDIADATLIFKDVNNTINKTTTTNSQGEYTIELPPGTYNGTAKKSGFSTAESLSRTVESNRTTTANFVIRRLLVPHSITVSPPSDTAFVGENNTFTVTVRDQNGDPLDSVTVDASSDNSLVTFTSSGSTTATATTDSQGQATFTVTSDNVADATLTFEAINGSGSNPTTTASKSFIQNGDGFIKGQVFDSSTTSGLEGATVWAVLEDTYNQNKFNTTLNLTNVSAHDDDRVFIRLIDSETGEVLNPNDYDLRRGHTNTTITKVSTLNVSNDSKGGGYAVFDDDGDDVVHIHHARVDQRDYYLSLSLDANNTGRTIVDDDGAESFTANLTHTDSTFSGVVSSTPFGAGQNTTNASGNGHATFAPAASLNLSATKDRAQQSGANLWDVTDEDGDYDLTKLYTDRQNGKTYVVMASKVGYSTDFADVHVTEDGVINGQENQGPAFFNVDPIPVEADGVNITQLGTINTAEANASFVPFEDTSDDTFQRVPRDGTTWDVIQVDTTAGGQPINGTAEITVADPGGVLDLEFVEVDGGTIVDQPDNETIVVATGDDGTALVALETDQNTTSVDTNKTATLTNNRAVQDTSNVTFVGVVTFGSASISGIVTDSNDDPIADSAVWTTRFTLGPASGNPDLVVIQPDTTASPDTAAYAEAVDDDSDEFIVALMTYNGTSGSYEVANSATVTAGELQSYDFSDFPSLSAGGVTDYKLYQRASPEEATYTLDPVPAVEGGAVTQHRVTGVKLEAPFQGRTTNDAIAQVLPGTTDDANLVIPIDIVAANLQVSGVSDQTVQQGDTLSVTATIENTGGDQGSTQTVELTVGGQTLDSQTVTVASGDTVTVTLSGDTSGLSEGDHTMTVSSADDSDSATLTVEGGSDLARFDADGSGEIEFGEVLDAIGAFNDDTQIGGEDVTFNDVLDVIGAFNDGTSV